jgi:putative spermidine/putrescine transport system permease protein
MMLPLWVSLRTEQCGVGIVSPRTCHRDFTGTFLVGMPDVTTLALLMFNASIGGNYQIAAITALILLIPPVGLMLFIERFLKADVLAKVGG